MKQQTFFERLFPHEDELFQTPATIQSVQTLVDGGTKLNVITQELAAEELTKLFRLKGKLGWFVMKLSEINTEEIPDESIEDSEEGLKTPSKRLRAVMYVYWRDCTARKVPFNIWYAAAMDKEIERWKELLPSQEDQDQNSA